MMNGFKKTIGVMAIAVVLAGRCSPADAYVLPAPHILELMTQTLGRARSLFVSQTLTLYDPAMNQPGVEFSETLRYFFPSGFRSDISTKMTQRIHLVSNGRVLTIIDGKVVADVENRYDLYKDLFFYRSRKQLVKRLTSLGIDTSISSLGRFQGKIAFIVGAQYPDETVSQIWIDKKTLMPLRWISIAGTVAGRQDALDVQYHKWQRVDKIWYPALTEFYHQQRLIRKIEVEHVQTNVAFPGDLFDMVHLRSMYSPVDGLSPQGPAQKKENEVRKVIEEFKRIYE